MPVPAEVPPSALPHQTVSDKALTITKQGDEVRVRVCFHDAIIFQDSGWQRIE